MRMRIRNASRNALTLNSETILTNVWRWFVDLICLNFKIIFNACTIFWFVPVFDLTDQFISTVPIWEASRYDMVVFNPFCRHMGFKSNWYLRLPCTIMVRRHTFDIHIYLAVGDCSCPWSYIDQVLQSGLSDILRFIKRIQKSPRLMVPRNKLVLISAYAAKFDAQLGSSTRFTEIDRRPLNIFFISYSLYPLLY